MTTTNLATAQLPVVAGDAARLGPGMYRKRILNYGSLPYQGRTLTYDKPYGQKLVDNFLAGAYEQVPLVFADAQNHHTNDPARFRGEVKALELADGGVDALIMVGADGAKVLGDNPRLGVSPRIVEMAEHVTHLPAIQHVAATFDPRGRGLGEWHRIADLAGVYDSATVDLTALSMATETTSPEPLSDDEMALLVKADPVAVRALLAPAEPVTPVTEPQRTVLDRLLNRTPAPTEPVTPPAPANTDDADVERLLTEILGTDRPREAVASLSAEDRQAVELAASQAQAANARADTLHSQLRDQMIARERTERVAKGVPPAIVDLAVPFLGTESVVELADGAKLDAAAAMSKVLDELEGFIDLSGPFGSMASLEVEDDNAERQKQAARMAEGWS